MADEEYVPSSDEASSEDEIDLVAESPLRDPEIPYQHLNVQDVDVANILVELRSLFGTQVLEVSSEPHQLKTPWDHVLEEMVHMSKDLATQRKLKLAQAKKIAIATGVQKLKASSEPRRPKTPWDHLLVEMVGLSEHFVYRKKLKLALVKKLATEVATVASKNNVKVGKPSDSQPAVSAGVVPSEPVVKPSDSQPAGGSAGVEPSKPVVKPSDSQPAGSAGVEPSKPDKVKESDNQ